MRVKTFYVLRIFFMLNRDFMKKTLIKATNSRKYSFEAFLGQTFWFKYGIFDDRILSISFVYGRLSNYQIVFIPFGFFMKVFVKKILYSDL